MNWAHYFKNSELDESIISTDVFQRNVQFFSVISISVIPISIFHIFLFYANLDPSLELEYVWRKGIIFSHIGLSIYFSLMSILLYIYKHKYHISDNLIKFSLIAAGVVTVTFGVTIVTLDQLVTPAITPYLIICMMIPITLLLRPIYSFFLFAFSFILFYFLLPYTQPNETILLSNRVNGLSFVGIGFALSLLMWNISIKRFKQDRLIKEQGMELIESYDALVALSDKLKLTNATKDKFFSIIAHDLRSPFNSILGFSDLIQSEYAEGITKNISEYIGIVSDSAKQTILLLENLLLWANSQTGSLVFSPSTFNLNTSIENTFLLLGSNAKSKDISLNLVASQLFNVYLDQQLIETILRNLISNAIKYSRDNGSIIVSLKLIDSFFTISVSDDGVGIEQDSLEKIFLIDRNVSTKGTKGEQGSGLGLVLCKEFTELNHGTIEVKSEVNVGSCFILKFPMNRE